MLTLLIPSTKTSAGCAATQHLHSLSHQPPQHSYICLPGEDKAAETGKEERGEKRRLSPATWSLSPPTQRKASSKSPSLLWQVATLSAQRSRLGSYLRPIWQSASALQGRMQEGRGFGGEGEVQCWEGEGGE